MARYDSMHDINAIYSQIGKPPVGNGALGGGPQAKKKSKMKPMNPYHTVDRLNGYGVTNGPPHAKSHTSPSQNHPDAFSGHVNGGTTFQHFDAFE